MTFADVTFDAIDAAVAAFELGRPVVIYDANGSEPDADLAFPAGVATKELMGLLVRNSTGVVGVAMSGETLDRLAIPPMTAINEHSRGVGMAVGVNAATVTGIGSSASDRVATVRALANPNANRGALTRPGYVFPFRGVAGGVLRRAAGTEACLDLARLAGIAPAVVFGELVDADGDLLDLPGVRAFADANVLPLISIQQLIEYRLKREESVEQVGNASLPTEFGEFRIVGFRSLLDGSEHVALVAGDITDGENVLVRVHAECELGDVVCSTRCQCNERLHRAMERIQQEGRGVLVYVRAQTAQGSGMLARLSAYATEVGTDTSHAAPNDIKNHSLGSQIIRALGIRSMRLLTSTPNRTHWLEGFGLSLKGVEAL